MRDRLTKERRSWNMSRIRGKHTAPELIVRKLLHRMGYRFRLHVRIPIPLEGRVTTSPTLHPPSRPSSSKSIPPQPSTLGTQPLQKPSTSAKIRYVRPDIVLPKYKTAIFVHGCFWHRHRGCKNCTTPINRMMGPIWTGSGARPGAAKVVRMPALVTSEVRSKPLVRRKAAHVRQQLCGKFVA